MTRKSFEFCRFHCSMLNTFNWQHPHISAFRKLHNSNFSGPRHFRPRILNQHPSNAVTSQWLALTLPPSCCLHDAQVSNSVPELRGAWEEWWCEPLKSTVSADCPQLGQVAIKPEPQLETEKQMERISRGTQGFPNTVTIFSTHTHSNSA